MESGKAGRAMFAYVGCFTTEKRKARGKGVAVFSIDANGKWTFVHACDAVPNPHYVAFDRSDDLVDQGLGLVAGGVCLDHDLAPA